MKGTVFLFIALIVLLVISKYMEKNEHFTPVPTNDNTCGNGWFNSGVGCATYNPEDYPTLPIPTFNTLAETCDGAITKDLLHCVTGPGSYTCGNGWGDTGLGCVTYNPEIYPTLPIPSLNSLAETCVDGEIKKDLLHCNKFC